jgi:hypothetical protein
MNRLQSNHENVLIRLRGNREHGGILPPAIPERVSRRIRKSVLLVNPPNCMNRQLVERENGTILRQRKEENGLILLLHSQTENKVSREVKTTLQIEVDTILLQLRLLKNGPIPLGNGGTIPLPAHKENHLQDEVRILENLMIHHQVHKDDLLHQP